MFATTLLSATTARELLFDAKYFIEDYFLKNLAFINIISMENVYRPLKDFFCNRKVHTLQFFLPYLIPLNHFRKVGLW